MPRVALSMEQKMEYRLKDFKKWVKMQMAAKGKTQADVGEVLGLSRGRVSQMLKIVDPKRDKGKKEEKDPFSYGQVLVLCEFFGANEEEKKKLLTL